MAAKLKCSFCGKSEQEVAKLVAGTGGQGTKPSVYICDECVAVARRVMDEAEPPRPRGDQK